MSNTTDVVCMSTQYIALHHRMQFNIDIQYTYLPTVQYRYPVHIPSYSSISISSTHTFLQFNIDIQ